MLKWPLKEYGNLLFVIIICTTFYGCSNKNSITDGLSKKSQPRTTWMADGTYGLMVHYLVSPPGQTQQEKTSNFNNTVNCFDVDNFVEQIDKSRADWLIFTLGQNTGYYCSPNSFLDTYLPGRTSQRDLALEIARGLKQKGIRLILYLPAEVHIQSDEIKKTFAWNKEDHSEFLKRYLKFVQNYSLKFGTLCDGWWFDGCYEELHENTDQYWQKWADAARAGNPHSIIAFNNGAFCVNKIQPVSSVQDYHAGEVHMLEDSQIRTDVIRQHQQTYYTPQGYLRAEDQKPTYHMPKNQYINNVQWHALVPLDCSFNAPAVPEKVCSYNDKELLKFIMDCKAVKGAVTFNVPLEGCGKIPDKTFSQTQRIGKHIEENTQTL